MQVNFPLLFSATILALSIESAHAEAIPGEYLVKFSDAPGTSQDISADLGGAKVNWAVPEQNIALIKAEPAAIPDGDVLDRLRQRGDVESIQPNFRYRAQLFFNEEQFWQPVANEIGLTLPAPQMPNSYKPNDPIIVPAKPEVRAPTDSVVGVDAFLMQDKDLDLANVRAAWEVETGSRDTVVAVLDTGVDYNHEDLALNMWHDPSNAKHVGWDFIDNDARPYDLTSAVNVITGVGNPGHGTHCAGNIGAVGDNSLGTSGVAKNVSIMALRMLNQEGTGETAAAIRAIDYATQHGARIISASWGSDGASEDDQLLKEAILRAHAKGVLFIAAAGNTQAAEQKNSDNDNNPAKRTFPASFDLPNIISVAASDLKGHMASFTHFGAKSVHLAAPGERSFSTVPETRDGVGYPGTNKYEDTMDLGTVGKAPWDGTSMATPQVSGAAALLISHHPGWSFAQVKKRLMQTVRVEPTFAGKTATGGVLDVGAALKD